MTLDQMWERCERCGYTENLAETREGMIEYIIDNIRRNMKVCGCLSSIENKPRADYYGFDISSYSTNPAKPIYGKPDLMKVLIVEV